MHFSPKNHFGMFVNGFPANISVPILIKYYTESSMYRNTNIYISYCSYESADFEENTKN